MIFAGTPSQEFGSPDHEFEGAPVTKERLLDQALLYVSSQIEYFDLVYKFLSDDEPKDFFLTTVAYREFGWQYVGLPLNTSESRDAVTGSLKAAANTPENTKIKTKNAFASLIPISLKQFGYEINIHHGGWGIFKETMYSQYEYRSPASIPKLQGCEFVLNCRAYWGGTSLIFVEQIGYGDTIISLEFFRRRSKYSTKTWGRNRN